MATNQQDKPKEYSSAIVDLLDREPNTTQALMLYPITRIVLLDIVEDGTEVSKEFIVLNGKWEEVVKS